MASGEVADGDGDSEGTTATTLGAGVGVASDGVWLGVCVGVSAATDEALAGGVVWLAPFWMPPRK
jgi:hypothetical protein